MKHVTSGLIGKRCSKCGELFESSALLFPVEQKNYHDGHLIEREWKAMRIYLRGCFMFTVFGYSAPRTDVEAVALLKEAWGEVEERRMEQTEVIVRPGADHGAVHDTWEPFIHSHHYEIQESLHDSWLAHHPRRSGEAYRNQYLDAKFISNNTLELPRCADAEALGRLVRSHRPEAHRPRHQCGRGDEKLHSSGASSGATGSGCAGIGVALGYLPEHDRVLGSRGATKSLRANPTRVGTRVSIAPVSVTLRWGHPHPTATLSACLISFPGIDRVRLIAGRA